MKASMRNIADARPCRKVQTKEARAEQKEEKRYILLTAKGLLLDVFLCSRPAASLSGGLCKY